MDEPERGSVVLTQGRSGTAWQRHFSDGLWHSTTGQIQGWGGLLASDPVRDEPIVVYVPSREVG